MLLHRYWNSYDKFYHSHLHVVSLLRELIFEQEILAQAASVWNRLEKAAGFLEKCSLLNNTK